MAGRILGVDYGKKRIGVAVSDPLGIIARGLETICQNSLSRAISKLADIAQKYNVECIVVGLPLTLKGEKGEAARAVDELVEKLKIATKTPIVLVDERYTSIIARKVLLDFGKSPSRNKAKIDEISAMLILQTYLDSSKNKS